MLDFNGQGNNSNLNSVYPVADNMYMLTSKGGNVVFSVGDDGVLLVDNQYRDSAMALQDAIREITPKTVNMVINTHWHEDHTGGNKLFRESGAKIIAHENTRKRLSTGMVYNAINYSVPPADVKSLPSITFSNDLCLHWNSDDIYLTHMKNAHTDSDVIVKFVNANVVQVADIYFNGFYPIIDVESGGSMVGMIRAVEGVLAVVDDETIIVPGHGPLSSKPELLVYRDILLSVYESVSAQKSQGATVEEVVASRPTASYDEQWGIGFLTPDQWVSIVYWAI